MMKSGEKILGILELFNMETRELSVAEMAEKLNQPQSSVYRSVRVLKESHYLEETLNGLYRLGHKFLRFASLVQMDNDLISILRPYMKRLTQEIGETTILTIVSGLHSICLDSVASGQFLHVSVQPGKIFPLYGGASSKILLAYLPECTVDTLFDEKGVQQFTQNTIVDREVMKKELTKIKERGYDFSSGEYEAGLSAIAVPIRDMTNEVVAGLSVVTLEERFKQLDREMILQKLQETAQMVQKFL